MKNIKHLTRVGLLLLAVTQALPSVASEAETFPSFSPRFGANYTTSGAGFDEFGSLEAFIPVLQSPGKNLTFLEGKLLWTTSNGALGGNLLLGHRFKSDSGKYLVGGYVSFDSRNTGETVFNQLGAGFESLSDSLDFRANAYLPIGNKNVVLAETNPGTFAFRGNALEIDRVQLVQQALTGFDAEVGTKLASLGSGSLRGYAGLYYYSSQDIDGFVGVRGRLVARPTDNLVAGLSLQSDSVFDTRLTFTIGANLSPGSSSRKSKNSVLARMGESPERQSNITVDNLVVKDSVAAIDPATGLAYNFQHVNLGLGNSNGTIESPFGTVQAALNVAKPGDIVYVRSGTNPGVPGFKIPDGVEVTSAAVPKFVQTQIGTVQIPGSGSGVLPNVTGTVALGNNTTLSGFTIANSTGAGIEGSNIRNISIEDNTITNSRFQSINFKDVTGTVEILDNTIDKTGTLADGTPADGISINNSSGASKVLIDGNTVNNAANHGINVALLGNAEGNVNITDNITTGNKGTGIYTNFDENVLRTVNIANNVVSGNGDGIAAESNISTQSAISQIQSSLSIKDNTITNSNLNGIYTNNVTGKVEIAGNTIDATRNSSGIFTSNDKGTADLVITGNQVKNGDAEGIVVNLQGNVKGNANISNNTTTSNRRFGILLEGYDNAQVTATISNNTSNKNSSFGLFTDFTDNSQGNVTITNNKISSNKNSSILSQFSVNSQGSVIISGNNVSENTGSGVSFGLFNNAKASATISNNQISGNKVPTNFSPFPGGITLGADGASEGNVSITNNTLTDNYYGIVSATNENAKLQLSIASNNITNNLQDGVAITTSLPLVNPAPGTSQTNISLQNNTVTGNNTTGAGFDDVSVANFRNGSNMCVQAKNNTFSSLTLADKPISVPLATLQTLFFKQQQGTITPSELQTLILSQLNGTVRVEGAFPGTNKGALNPASQFGVIWSRTTAAAGSCGFGN